MEWINEQNELMNEMNNWMEWINECNELLNGMN